LQTFNTMSNPILCSDGYKFTHWLQYPEDTEYVYSYMESRGGKFDKTTVFGIQYYTNLLSQIRITQEHIDEAEEFCRGMFGCDGYFNREGWEIILNDHDGKIPLEIRAVPEGTNLPTRNVIMTMVNTDPRLPWVTNFFETLMLKVWYPTTVATQSRKIRELIESYAKQTGGSWGPFFLNDFGYRGVSSEESAGIGGASHLVNFWGTDTVAGIRFAKQYYNAGQEGDDPIGLSVFATEHSTTTIHGRENEHDAMIGFIRRIGKINPQAIASLVSDSYDIHRTVERMATYTKFRTTIMQHGLNGGRTVVRPDSGDPAEMALECIEGLSEGFIPEVNDAGYEILPPEIGVIYGDGINYDTIDRICKTLMQAGWAIDPRNIIFGMGGGLLQQLDRDTQRFAFKCCAAQRNGTWVDVYKDPISDKGKGSKRGRMKLIRIQTANGVEYSTVSLDHPADDVLQLVYLNGEQKNLQNFQSIRNRAAGVE
jgi:nicotinamide phosphoribosyltransferase